MQVYLALGVCNSNPEGGQPLAESILLSPERCLVALQHCGGTGDSCLGKM